MTVFLILFTLFIYVITESVGLLILGLLGIITLIITIVWWWKKIGSKL